MKLLSLADLCELLDVERHAIQRWVANGEFPAPFRVGRRHLRWFETDVKKWLRDQQKTAIAQQREKQNA